MANLQTNAEILNYMLFEAYEPVDGSSDFDSHAITQLNRAYRAIIKGGNELNPEENVKWWWLSKEGNLILKPQINIGSVSVTNNSTTINLTNGPVDSVAGYHFKVQNHPDIFKISSHTAASTTAELDSVYTGDTAAAASYKLMKYDYTLASDVSVVNQPMYSPRDNSIKIEGMSTESIQEQYPLGRAFAGIPERFAQLNEQEVRFSHHGSTTGDLIRIDYTYARVADDLADNSTEPLIPKEYRHVLADAGLFYLLETKEDNASDRVLARVVSGIQAMATENKSRWQKFGSPGHIYVRNDQSNRFGNRVLRTESGLIIGR